MSEYIKRMMTGIALVCIFAFAYFCCHPHVLSVLLGVVLCYILIFEWPCFFPRSRVLPWLVAPVYPILPFVLLMVMNEDAQFHKSILYLFGMVAAFDIGSYCVGSLMGKHRIAPTISPRKTWQGFVGGYFCSLVAFYMITTLYGTRPALLYALSCSIAIACAALIGDLFESWLKRRAGIKDSGNILPGHGGLLDRFDSMLGAVMLPYFVWLVISFL